MRKAAPLLLILMLLSSLPAQQRVSSNSIGQDRGRFAQGGEYSLLLEGGTSTLYRDDMMVWTRKRTEADGVVEISTMHAASGRTEFRRYEHNRLVSEGEGDRVRHFIYDEHDLMAKSMTLVSGELAEMELYSYDVGTSRLNSILTITKKGSVVSYFGGQGGQSWFSYTKDGLFTKETRLSGGVQIQELWKGESRIRGVEVGMLPEGGMLLTTSTQKGEESELYDTQGLLTVRTTPSFTTRYSYTEERQLAKAHEKGVDGQERIMRYEEGRMVSESLYQGGVLEKDTLYRSGKGKVETLYDNGVPYCDLEYALDGKRVLSIRYL
ncbi:MAG: hypothetical protein RBR15_04205 [Sphaerochaeta sp.]|nr:hypothetical protein [Sphaerochaeta sp.]